MSISFFIGEDGNIDKVMFHKIEEEVAGAIVNPEIENLFNEFLRFFENIRFTPGKIKGEAVKSAFSWSGIFHVDKNGEGKLKTDNKNANRYGLFKSLPTVPQNGDDFFVAVEQMPSPIGGISAIQQKIKYPEEAKLNGVQGRVFIKAFIDETGNVVRTEIIRGIGAGCDEVARKAVEETKFNPGKQRGKAVKTQVSIPILFKLN
ncbi:MAG: energy transducer TonB [Melioribacteraceae bacterium]|nr:energy transducer TonB [Melioribacteraceae bacterium]MCF8263576.1 energy transducer TonB [Melioribacteraceae bacterium]MCF8430816.1 energy transducer TonB [Melioribacteraceae bacterium]